jgi:hypothetical protein
MFTLSLIGMRFFGDAYSQKDIDKLGMGQCLFAAGLLDLSIGIVSYSAAHLLMSLVGCVL